MSERERQKKHAARLGKRIANLESVQSATGEELEDLRLALEIVSAPVRQRSECEMSVHTFQPRGYQEADCSACGKTRIWETDSEFCSKCGSTVVKAEKNYDPRERLERVAIQEAVNSIGGR